MVDMVLGEVVLMGNMLMVGAVAVSEGAESVVYRGMCDKVQEWVGVDRSVGGCGRCTMFCGRVSAWRNFYHVEIWNKI